MRVLHIQTDKIFAKEVRDIVEKNGFSYTCIWFRADMDEILDKVLEDHKYNFIIVDECISSLSVEHLINKVNAKGVIRPSIVVISSQHDFNTKKYYFQLGIMAFFNKKDFDRNRFEKYLQTVKYDIETINFLKNFHIAVIDDSKLSLNIIKNNFSSSGIFDVDYYQDSAKFLKCTQKYDLFLIDLLMPIYDGETLTNYIREKDHEAIIILITAYNNGQIIPHCLSIGADDFMIKPFDYNLFMLRIHSCISRYKMRKELIIKNRKLFDLAIKDNLTGIYNRTYFTDIYKKKIEAAQKYDSKFSLIMVDIDNFKNINDEYGHLKGDHVLKEVAIILQKALTEKGILYRWGGEEFIALLDIDATDEIIHMAEKMRRTVSMHKFINVRKITASFGVARWRYTDDYEKLLKRLDNSLYLAKFTGKNKIVYEENLNIVENGKPIEIEWGPFFSTNNPEIDKDHYKLAALSNELIKNSVNGSKKEVISGLLAQMLKNIVMHFKKEEKVMYNLHYKDFTKHRQSHRDLIVRILNLYDEYLIKNKDVVKVIEYLIQEVIIEHILKRDSEFYDTYSR